MATTPTTIVVNTPPIPESLVIDVLRERAESFAFSAQAERERSIRLLEYVDILEGQIYELTRERTDLIQDLGRMEDLLAEAMVV